MLWGGEKEYVDSDYKIQGVELDILTAPFRDVGYVYYSAIKPSTYVNDQFDFTYLNNEFFNKTIDFMRAELIMHSNHKECFNIITETFY